jgi:uncharacterized protein YyaL (SSP411 family)
MTENLLAAETSPYLLQHKDNPVHWRPWDKSALSEATRRNVPILLSVGYAACHWCHVMAHESFEDEETAALMNRLFVNIKVDREERPDLDALYQSALALLGEHGGWPLTMFLNKSGEPFWGGTYFPPTPHYGRPAFRDILLRISEVYRAQPEDVAKNADALVKALKTQSVLAAGDMITPEMTDAIATRLLREADTLNGGIGGAPKFPQPAILEFFWRAHLRTGKAAYRDAVLLTLERMSQGGIYDHLGGGFARYTVDEIWLVPHFEKMLYDNAQLIDILTLAWQETKQPLFADRVSETIAWAEREMLTPEGAFSGSLDADSEGEEGKFYVWDEPDIDRLLGDKSPDFKAAYDVTAAGNWEGRNILNRRNDSAPTDPARETMLLDCRERLLAARGDRIRPGLDDKILADWNGLMIAALANAGTVFAQPRWIELAARTFAFICDRMTLDNRLRHSWRTGKANHPATLEDYANMTRAALQLHESTGDPSYLDQAECWAATTHEHYWDPDDGGYFLTADNTDDLIARTKTVRDNAVPAGNGVMIAVLARLFYLTGRAEYHERATACVRAFSSELDRNVFPLATFLNANALLDAALQIVIIGARNDPETKALLRAVNDTSLPNRVLQVFTPAEDLPTGHPAQGKGQVAGRATVYICEGQTCSLPITEPEELARAFRGR